MIDFVDGLQGAGFKVENPNVIAACGCGSSFRVAEEEEVLGGLTPASFRSDRRRVSERHRNRQASVRYGRHGSAISSISAGAGSAAEP